MANVQTTVSSYIEKMGALEQNTPDTPYGVFVYNVTTGNSAELAEAIKTAGRYVSLEVNGTCASPSHLFENVSELVRADFSAYDFSSATDCSYMFAGCSNLKSVSFRDSNTSPAFKSARNVSYMFKDCISLPSGYLEGFSNVEYMTGMFDGCTSIGYVVNQRYFNVKHTDYMFRNCTSLKTFDFRYLTQDSYMRLRLLESMDYMFSGCTGLESIDNLLLYTANEFVSARYAFSGCTVLNERFGEGSFKNRFFIDGHEELIEGFIDNSGGAFVINGTNSTQYIDYLKTVTVRKIFSGKTSIAKYEELLKMTDANEQIYKYDGFDFDNLSKTFYIVRNKDDAYDVEITDFHNLDGTNLQDAINNAGRAVNITFSYTGTALSRQFTLQSYHIISCTFNPNNRCTVEDGSNMFMSAWSLRKLDTSGLHLKKADNFIRQDLCLYDFNCSGLEPLVNVNSTFCGAFLSTRAWINFFLKEEMDELSTKEIMIDLDLPNVTGYDEHGFWFSDGVKTNITFRVNLPSIESLTANDKVFSERGRKFIFRSLKNCIRLKHVFGHLVNSEIWEIVFENDSEDYSKIINIDAFAHDCQKLKKVNIEKLKNVKVGTLAFSGCRNLTEINTSGFDNLEIADSMFRETSIERIDCSHFGNVQDAFSMFGYSKLKSIDLTHFKNVTSCNGMLSGCPLESIAVNTKPDALFSYVSFNFKHLITRMTVNNSETSFDFGQYAGLRELTVNAPVVSVRLDSNTSLERVDLKGDKAMTHLYATGLGLDEIPFDCKDTLEHIAISGNPIKRFDFSGYYKLKSFVLPENIEYLILDGTAMESIDLHNFRNLPYAVFDVINGEKTIVKGWTAKNCESLLSVDCNEDQCLSVGLNIENDANALEGCTALTAVNVHIEKTIEYSGSEIHYGKTTFFNNVDVNGHPVTGNTDVVEKGNMHSVTSDGVKKALYEINEIHQSGSIMPVFITHVDNKDWIVPNSQTLWQSGFIAGSSSGIGSGLYFFSMSRGSLDVNNIWGKNPLSIRYDSQGLHINSFASPNIWSVTILRSAHP